MIKQVTRKKAKEITQSTHRRKKTTRAKQSEGQNTTQNKHSRLA